METRDDGAPGFEVIYSCRLPKHGCQEPNLGPLQEQCALLTAKPPLKPCSKTLYKQRIISQPTMM